PKSSFPFGEPSETMSGLRAVCPRLQRRRAACQPAPCASSIIVHSWGVSMRCIFPKALIVCALLAFASYAAADDWPSWRGPTGQGQSDAKDLPLTWGGKTNDN